MLGYASQATLGDPVFRQASHWLEDEALPHWSVFDLDRSACFCEDCEYSEWFIGIRRWAVTAGQTHRDRGSTEN